MISKKRIRKVFAPLTINTNTEVTGDLDQVYESMFQRWTPNRYPSTGGTPLKIQPRVYLATGQGETSWVDGDYTSKLTNVTWYANGVLLRNTPLNGYFSVDVSGGASNGCLTITKNLSPAERYDLVMMAHILDTRTNQVIEIRTDIVQIGVSEITADEWDLSVVHDTAIKYYPLLDKLKEYDWKVANGKIAASTAERNKCIDGNQYELSLPVIISRGHNVIGSRDKYYNDCSIELFVDRGADGYVKVSPETCIFLRSISLTQIVLDQRFIPDMTNMKVELKVGGKSMGYELLSFSLSIGKYDCDPINGGDIDLTVSYRNDKALCTVNGQPMEYPEAYLDINWYTTTSNASKVYHGNGETVTIDMARANIGTGANCWMDTIIESKVKAFCAAISVDADGNVIVVDDKNNAILYTDVLRG